MKVILSRKGFDSSAGGYPSPYFVESGRLLSLPIPEENNSNNIDTNIYYSDLQYENEVSYLDLMKQLGIKNFDNKYVHLDPDLNPNTLNNRKENWNGIFGQASSAQAHLKNKGIKEGDIFLFYGWFKDVVKTSNGYKYISGTDKHIIWGYLQVGHIEDIKEDKSYCQWKNSHPHYYYRNRQQNTGYIASDTLSFNNKRKGCGIFKFREPLVLTCPGQRNRSVWKLPIYFHPEEGTTMSYHENILTKSGKVIWNLEEEFCTLQSVGRGQEFVIEGDSRISDWVKTIFDEK